jgi:hypothetical protein
MDAVGNCLGAGCLDGWQAVGQDRAEDVDHLPIVKTGERRNGAPDRIRTRVSASESDDLPSHPQPNLAVSSIETA